MAERSLKVAENSTGVSEEQLELAREEAARRALLEVRMELLPLGNFRHVWQQLESEGAYEGPPPDNFLVMHVLNRGRAAAMDVSGQVHLDGTVFWVSQVPGPLQITSVQVGFEWMLVTVNLSAEGIRILPEPTTEKFRFLIPVKIIRGGTTRTKYALSTSQGDTIDGTWELDIPSYHVPGSGEYVGPSELDRPPSEWEK